MTTVVCTPPRIAAMRRSDLPQVLAIESRVSDRPWTTELFESELEAEDRRYLTAWSDGDGDGVDGPAELVGYGGILRAPDEVHVTTLAVVDGHRRRGVATHLMLALMHAAVRLDATAATLEVRATNLAAQRLYARFGFAPVGVRPGYYAATGEDAIIMWVHDIDRPSYADRLQSLRAALQVALGPGLPGHVEEVGS